MNKTFKIIFYNIIFLAIVLILAEITCFIKDYKINIYEPRHRENPIDVQFPSDFKKTFTFDEIYKRILKDPNEFRPAVGIEYKKNPIVIFGCSFAFGDRLKENQTFSSKLSELAKRPVYNRASCAWGFQQMLYQIRNNDIFNTVKKEPEYIIYLFINQHVYRFYQRTYQFPFNNMLYLRYKQKNNNLEEIKPLMPILERSSLLGTISHEQNFKQAWAPENFDKNFDLIKLYLKIGKKELQEKWKNTKFVVLKYNHEENPPLDFSKSERWKELEQDGFIILDTTELTGRLLNEREDLADDGFHPSEKAWDLLTPLIIEKLNL